MIQWRWLGTAGIELRENNQVLVVDPYLTRFPAWKAWVGRVHPNQELISETMKRCDYILVTHAHWDHIMDVPDIVRNTGATAYGSPNSCRLLTVCGVPGKKIRAITAGDELALNGFRIEVLQSEHMKIPGFGLGPLAPRLKPPLSARDYCMDGQFCFRITVGGWRLLTSPGVRPEDAAPADVLFVIPKQDRSFLERLLQRVQPRIVIPYHWDDFFRPLDKPLRPFWQAPRWGWPPLQRMDLAGFREMVEQIAPATRVLEPDAFHSQELGDFT